MDLYPELTALRFNNLFDMENCYLNSHSEYEKETLCLLKNKIIITINKNWQNKLTKIEIKLALYIIFYYI